jgi:hypothetical protein
MAKRREMMRKPGERKPAAGKSTVRKAAADTDLRKKNTSLRLKLTEALDYQAYLHELAFHEAGHEAYSGRES